MASVVRGHYGYSLGILPPLMKKRARNELAKNVKIRRIAQGWSQEELAQRSSVSRTYISLVERALCDPKLDSLEKLAAAFGITVSSLLDTPDAENFWQPLVSGLMEPKKRKER